MEDKTMRKQRRPLELFLTAILPVMVLSFGFFTFSIKTGLNSGETASPSASGDYYRSPGTDGMYFGPEIYSDTLCGGRFNEGFQIVWTNESASVSASIPNAVNWNRHQSWYFSDNHDLPPWGTTYSYIDLDDDLGWSEISAGGGTTGFPWAGYEMHDLSSEGVPRVSSSSDVTGYRRHTENDGTRYVCPMYYKTGSWEYSCFENLVSSNIRFAYKYQFGDPEIHEGILSREVIAGPLQGTWHDCIELN